MTTDYSSPGAKARKMQSLILQRFQNNGVQTRIADEIGITDTWISRFKGQQLQQVCLILAHLDLKVVCDDAETIDAKKLEAFALLASDIFKSPERVVESLTGRRDE